MTQPQIIITPSGEELVVLPRAEYDALIAAADPDAEDAADVAAFDAAMADLAGGKDSALPPEVSAAVLAGATRVEAVRKWRKLTQQNLAEQAGIGQGYLSQIENRQRAGTRETLEKLARGMDVPVDWIA